MRARPQVHRATLLTGESVVIKVQRPGLRRLFEIDLNNLRILSEQLDKGDENRCGPAREGWGWWEEDGGREAEAWCRDAADSLASRLP